MLQLRDIATEESCLLERMRNWLSQIRLLSVSDFDDIHGGVTLLQKVRSETAEEINQLQHEALLLEAVRYIQRVLPETVALEWFWHPRQTSGAGEPDLRACEGSKVVIAAEATASENPIGTIDARMAQTLSKLQAMSSRQKFYFVRTDAMKRRAETKGASVRRITVVKL